MLTYAPGTAQHTHDTTVQLSEYFYIALVILLTYLPHQEESVLYNWCLFCDHVWRKSASLSLVRV